MRRVVVLGILLASVSLPVAAPSSSEPVVVAVSMDQPQHASSTTALLSGTVTGTDQVTIDRLVGTTWEVVQSVTADGSGGYRATVPATSTTTSYRGRALSATSQEVLVRALTTPPPPTVSIDRCGIQPRKPDGSYWSCTLAENFTGTTLNRSKWMPQTVFRSGTDTVWACYLDDPSVVEVRDDALHLTAKKLPESIACPGNKNLRTPYVAGMVSTYQLFSQRYGRFEARIKTTATTSPGLQESFWLWPDNRYNTAPWPAAGEIDIAETYSQYWGVAIPYLHYTDDDNGGPVGGLNTAWGCLADRGVYNTYTLEWTASRLDILVNGKTCLVNTSGDPAFRKPYIVALTQLLGAGTNGYDGRAPLPATMSVDYVRVWK